MPAAARVPTLVPARVASDDPKLLTLPQVCRRVGLGRSKVYALIQDGVFPRPNQDRKRVALGDAQG